MMAAMGHKLGMVLGKDADGIRIPPECPWRPLRAGLGSIQGRRRNDVGWSELAGTKLGVAPEFG